MKVSETYTALESATLLKKPQEMKSRHKITDPDELRDLARRLSEQDPAAEKVHLELHLMQPLRDHSMIAACRNPRRRYKNVSGRPEGKPVLYEILDSNTWSKSWRAALAAFPAECVDTITFNIVMPEAADEDGARVYFYLRMPDDRDALGVEEMDVYRLCIGLATVTRMRSSNQVAFEAGDGWSLPRRRRDDLDKEAKRAIKILKDLSRPEVSGNLM